MVWSGKGRTFILVVLILCLAGMGVSIELTRIHVLTHTDPEFLPVCAVSDQINCETVASSPYSVFAGLPVSVWGIMGYLAMFSLALWALSPWRLHPSWPLGALALLFGFSVVASALLAYISAAKIDSLCLFCMASYVINAALLALGIVMIRHSGVGLREAIVADARVLLARAPLLGAIALVGVAVTSAAEILVEPYWKTHGWSELPELSSGRDGHGHHWIGAENPVVTVVEFSDYECPHCRRAHKNMRLLAAENPDTVRLVHRHLPLDRACHPAMRGDFHKHACRFAEAAECAGSQGHFWQMNDALFSLQDEIKAADIDLQQLAVRLGLDRPAFRACMAEHRTLDRVRSDIQEAMKRGIRGTPTFVVGAKLFVGRIPDSYLERALANAATG